MPWPPTSLEGVISSPEEQPFLTGVVSEDLTGSIPEGQGLAGTWAHPLSPHTGGATDGKSEARPGPGLGSLGSQASACPWCHLAVSQGGHHWTNNVCLGPGTQKMPRKGSLNLMGNGECMW